MRVMLPKQEVLDKYWAARDTGVSKIEVLTAITGLTKRAQAEVEKNNWRVGYDCDLMRKEFYLEHLRTLWGQGINLNDAARQVGLSYSDAANEHRAMMERFRELRREAHPDLRPKHITAEMYSDLWYLQQQQAFARAMLEAHPEYFGTRVAEAAL